MLTVMLFEPEIPGNTGNIIRLCANTGVNLHLVEPLGFALDDSKLKRAGLDYHEWASMKIHANWQAAKAALPNARFFAMTTKGSHSVFAQTFQSGDVLVFGPESRGLPADMLAEFAAERRLRLPMRPESRSLNLSNAVAVSVYEAWRQLDFLGGQ